ncbi:gliding motility-associated ABC transporter permease subunit GldF [Nonlabens agnitus]|uniref:Gliding motility-associated ABC transporter permease subunit GldF n=1 Tax=Nonlabens agnitus TaxID=870484 RepID=A0A2S9WSG8_9FLAO|nr:gliding motility-associated ABC transporter permease subunit GldF [Nonlabens agnitus]PRP66420.1 gliding motility-associated ABC transporter permease subunit GldF [Nonlabens agnitus]
MKAIYLKEIRGFFSSLSGYLVLCIFLLVSGLFVFVFDGEFNVLNYGFADLTPFFLLIPWLFMFLIPAICMRSFTVERDLGTLEILLTRPISIRSLIGGKFAAAFTITTLALVPTIIYVITVGTLGQTSYNIDLGSTFGSYLGALLMSLGYVSISIWCSTVTKNQIIAFLIAALVCFVMYFGFEGAAGYLVTDDLIASFGMKYHYESMARGVIDTRDVVYFVSVAVFFFALSEISLKKSLNRNS